MIVKPPMFGHRSADKPSGEPIKKLALRAVEPASPATVPLTVYEQATAEIAKLKAQVAAYQLREQQQERQELRDFVSLKAAAIDTGLPYETIRRWERDKLVESHHHGGRISVSLSGVKMLARLRGRGTD